MFIFKTEQAFSAAPTNGGRGIGLSRSGCESIRCEVSSADISRVAALLCAQERRERTSCTENSRRRMELG